MSRLPIRLSRSTRVSLLVVVAVFVLIALTLPVAVGGVGTNEGQDDENVTIAETVESAEGTIEVLVRLEDAPTAAHGEDVSIQDQLQTHTETSQQPIVDFADRREGVTVKSQFWLVNAILLEVETDRVDLADVGAIDGVTGLSENHRVYAQSSVIETDGPGGSGPSEFQATVDGTTNASGQWTGPPGTDDGVSTNGTVTATVSPPDSGSFVDEAVTKELVVENDTVLTVELETESESDDDGGGGGGDPPPGGGFDDDDDGDDTDDDEDGNDSTDNDDDGSTDEDDADSKTGEGGNFEESNDIPENDDSTSDSEGSTINDTVETNGGFGEHSDGRTDTVPGFGIGSALLTLSVLLGVVFAQLVSDRRSSGEMH